MIRLPLLLLLLLSLVGIPFAAAITALTDSNFRAACEQWNYDQSAARATYGDIEGWNTGAVTDMKSAFYDADLFNDDISGWDVSKVTTMMFMFRGAHRFNRDISSWDVSSVTDMSYVSNERRTCCFGALLERSIMLHCLSAIAINTKQSLSLTLSLSLSLTKSLSLAGYFCSSKMLSDMLSLFDSIAVS
jgi:surface protein